MSKTVISETTREFPRKATREEIKPVSRTALGVTTGETTKAALRVGSSKIKITCKKKKEHKVRGRILEVGTCERFGLLGDKGRNY